MKFETCFNTLSINILDNIYIVDNNDFSKIQYLDYFNQIKYTFSSWENLTPFLKSQIEENFSN